MLAFTLRYLATKSPKENESTLGFEARGQVTGQHTVSIVAITH